MSEAKKKHPYECLAWREDGNGHYVVGPDIVFAENADQAKTTFLLQRSAGFPETDGIEVAVRPFQG